MGINRHCSSLHRAHNRARVLTMNSLEGTQKEDLDTIEILPVALKVVHR